MLTRWRPTGTFDAVLAALCADRGRYFGDPGAVIHQTTRIEQPFSSILRLRVETSAGVSNVYVKVLKPRKPGPEELAELRRLLENEYSAMLRLHDALSARADLVTVRPRAVLTELLAVVTDEVRGQRFDRLVWRARFGGASAAGAIQAARSVGTWVRAYQEVTPPHGKATVGREYLDVRLRALAGPVLTPEDRDRALRAFDELSAHTATAPPLTAIHGDLCPTNVVVQPGGGVTVLDFTTAKTGSRLHDVTHLYLHLEFSRPRASLRRDFPRALQRALLDGFDDRLSPEDPHFKLMLLQHLACHLALLAQRAAAHPRLPGTRAFLRRRWQRYLPLWAGSAGIG